MMYMHHSEALEQCTPRSRPPAPADSEPNGAVGVGSIVCGDMPVLSMSNRAQRPGTIVMARATLIDLDRLPFTVAIVQYR